MAAKQKISDQEAQARIEALRAQQRAALWATPVLSDSDIPVALGLAPSSWQALKFTPECPPLFHIGKRVFARVSVLQSWLEKRCAYAPRRKPRKAA